MGGRGFAVRRWKVPRRDGACFWKLCFYSSSGPSSFSASVPSSYSDASHTSSHPSSCSETVIKVKILADDYGSETTWDLIDQRDGELVRSGGPYNPNQEVEDEFCISAAQYKFTIQDSL